ncbi:hypothetical protein [Nonomuraea basaltis]|uniref:hypothetical protein n=1 Tax=Nonomuraea basaltis TaxID=2495887 RepID=UPI00110C6897|nr:hypothetical protein [Nonomuraea basaltis]TMR99478.1 hypothetical protein EJK15_06600 [Nonomuraea basaltis]
MSDYIGAVFAVMVGFALLCVGMWFLFRKPDPEQPQVEPPEYTAEQTFTVKTTNIALVWFRRALGPARSERPGDTGGNQRARDDQGDDQADDETLRPVVPVVVEQVRPQQVSPPPPQPVAPARPTLAPPPTPTIEVTVERSRPARPAAVEAEPVGDQLHNPVPAPVELEGIDMSQAPLVPAGNGTTTPLPTVPQLQEALATGGFDRFMAWLRAFFKASGALETDARRAHDDLMDVAHRARNKYFLALQAFHAVQADELDARTVSHMWGVLASAQQEAHAAALATQYTAELVTACGGSPPAVASAIRALDDGHGDIARSVKAAPVRVVRKFSFYEN